jgi:hypothetical protein
MSRIIKHITLIVSTGLAMLPILLSLAFLVQQFRVKTGIKRSLEKQYLQTVRLPLDELHWIEKGKELQIGDELFDVKTWSIQNNEAVLTGLYDKKEKDLHLQLDKLIARQSTGDNANTAAISSFIFAFNSCENSFFSYQPSYVTKSNIFCLIPTPSLSVVFAEPLPLPPNAS